MDWDSLMDGQGAQEQPEGRPGGTGDFKTARDVPLALLPIPGPPGLPSGLLALGPGEGARGAIANEGGGEGQSPPPPSKSYYGHLGPGA